MKIIYTVQHTQSEDHVNGYVGAWGNWNLTDLGEGNGKPRDWYNEHVATSVSRFIIQSDGGSVKISFLNSQVVS